MPANGVWVEQTEKRTRNGKKRVDSADPHHFVVDVTIGSVHYKDNPTDSQEQWKEIDNVFEPAVAFWDWQMLKAGYHIRLKDDFTAGQIIEFEKQGETVRFQPMALEWTNDLDQIQQISMPQDVTPTITNPIIDLLSAVGVPSHQGTIKWNDGYGAGIDFEWKCSSTRLVKILEIENLNKLPVPEQYILDGGNPVLRLNLIFDPSNGVDIYVDGELWDRNSKTQSFNIIEFRKDGEVLWGFIPLRYWGSGEGENNEGQSVATLEKRGNKLYISIRVPYEWLQSVVYPVFIDTDVDEQVSASEDDGYCYHDNGNRTFYSSLGILDIGNYTRLRESFYRFDDVVISDGATIITAYISLYENAQYGNEAKTKISAEDVANPSAPTNCTEYLGVTLTTNKQDWDGALIAEDWNNSPEIKLVIQELIDTNSYASGAAIIIFHKDDGTTADGMWRVDEWDKEVDHSTAPKLHIEYEEEAPPAKVTQYLAGNDYPVFPHELDLMSDKLPCPLPYD